MDCFAAAPEFIDEDNRLFRKKNPISKQQMLSKHEALFPEPLVKGKTVLDIGSCMGTTGHWCLSHGARHYTGVELQQGYVDLSSKLLDRYHPHKHSIHCSSVEEWLKNPQEPSYDIVCLLGVLPALIDYYSVLKNVSALAREWVIIESSHVLNRKKSADFCGVEFLDDQFINLADQKASMVGRGVRVSPKGLEWLMKEFGFESKEGLIYPAPIFDIPDVYRPIGVELPKRFLIRFVRTGIATRGVAQDIQIGQGTIEQW